MKMKYLMLCGALFLGTVALTSCSEDESYDVYGSNTNKVFFDPYANPVQTNDIYVTPAGVFGVVGGQFNVKAQYASDERITVGAEVDNSLVAAYNKKNETSYAVLPTEAMNALKVEAAVIQPGKSVSENPVSVTVPSEACGSLTEEYYLVPMRLCVEGFEKNGSSYEVGVRDTFNTVYAVVHNAGSDFIYTKGSFEQTNAVVVTPVGVFGGVNASFNVAVRANNDAEFTIKASVDNSLIATYNTKHGTEYTAVPADIASKLVIGEGKIAAGQLETSPAVTVTDPTKAAENIENDCILPLKMTFVYPNGTEAELPNAYVIITKKTSFINDDATSIVGSEMDDKSAWSAIDCSSAFNASNFSNLFAGGWNSNWPIVGNEDSGQFTVDLGGEHNLVGLYLNSYVVKQDYTVEVSTDKSTWTELGSVEGHKAIQTYDSDWNYLQEYVLYGAVKSRYVRFNVNFNKSSWAWNYSGYKGISAINLYFN